MSNLISGTQTFHSQRSAGGKKEPFCSPAKAVPHKEAEQKKKINKKKKRKKGLGFNSLVARQRRASRLPLPAEGREKQEFPEWETSQAVLLQAKKAIAPSHSNSNASLGEDEGKQI